MSFGAFSDLPAEYGGKNLSVLQYANAFIYSKQVEDFSVMRTLIYQIVANPELFNQIPNIAQNFILDDNYEFIPVLQAQRLNKIINLYFNSNSEDGNLFDAQIQLLETLLGDRRTAPEDDTSGIALATAFIEENDQNIYDVTFEEFESMQASEGTETANAVPVINYMRQVPNADPGNRQITVINNDHEEAELSDFESELREDTLTTSQESNVTQNQRSEGALTANAVEEANQAANQAANEVLREDEMEEIFTEFAANFNNEQNIANNTTQVHDGEWIPILDHLAFLGNTDGSSFAS